MEDRNIGTADNALTAPSAGGFILGMRVDGITAADAITRLSSELLPAEVATYALPTCT